MSTDFAKLKRPHAAYGDTSCSRCGQFCRRDTGAERCDCAEIDAALDAAQALQARVEQALAIASDPAPNANRIAEMLALLRPAVGDRKDGCGQPFYTEASTNTQTCGRRIGHIGHCYFHDPPVEAAVRPAERDALRARVAALEADLHRALRGDAPRPTATEEP